jgi:nucleoside-diphosphate-sugar epimerase
MILVTGGTGFVGSFLIRELLTRGEHVRAICRPSSSFDLVDDIRQKVEWIEADLLDLPALERAFPGMTTVYHCAAVVSHRRRDEGQMMRSNVVGTANIVNLCLAHDVKKLVHVSSIAALGRSSKRQVIDETAEWTRSRYNAPYGQSKFRSEREVWRGVGEGLDAVIVNPSVILGPGQWVTGTGRLFRLVSNGLRIYPASYTGFVDVRDVVECMIRLMKSSVTGQRFVVSAENRSMKDVLSMIAQALERKPPAIKAGHVIVRLALAYEWLRSLAGKYPRFTRALARNAHTAYEYDHGLIRKTLDFEFRRLDETIRWTAAAYRSRTNGFRTFQSPSMN